MNKVSLWVHSCLLGSLPVLVGCGGLEEFPTAPVSGRVLCEGKPVPGAMVYFEPVKEGENAIVGKPGFAIADETGAFTLGTYSSNDGAVVGAHRVRVDPPNTGIPDDCNCEMDSNYDVMYVDVVDGDNTFDVTLKVKKGRSAEEMTEEEREEMMDGEEDS